MPIIVWQIFHSNLHRKPHATNLILFLIFSNWVSWDGNWRYNHEVRRNPCINEPEGRYTTPTIYCQKQEETKCVFAQAGSDHVSRFGYREVTFMPPTGAYYLLAWCWRGAIKLHIFRANTPRRLPAPAVSPVAGANSIERNAISEIHVAGYMKMSLASCVITRQGK
jgi:hypothetical protein